MRLSGNDFMVKKIIKKKQAWEVKLATKSPHLDYFRLYSMFIFDFPI